MRGYGIAALWTGILLCHYYVSVRRVALGQESESFTRQRSYVNSFYTENKYCVPLSKGAEQPVTTTELCYSPERSALNELNVQPFKDRHHAQSAVILCPGPTLNEYAHEGVDERGGQVITVGVNGVIFSKHVQSHGLDYFFVQDSGRGRGYKLGTEFHLRVDDYTNFKPRLQTFYGTFRNNDIGPTAEEAKKANAKRYESEYPSCSQLVPLVSNVGEYAFGGSCSVTMSALQFILYTGISNLQLVGCDVSSDYAWGQERDSSSNEQLRAMWNLVPEFLIRHYPSVRVKVIRPVGLKDIFNSSR